MALITIQQIYDALKGPYDWVTGASSSKPKVQNVNSSGTEIFTDTNPGSVKVTGSFVRLSTEPTPTAADGVKDGDDLLLVDTKEVYIYYQGTWYLQ